MRSHLPWLIWAWVILVLSGLPPSQFPRAPIIPGLDKVVHFCFYAVLVWLAGPPLIARNNSNITTFAQLVFLGVGYGIFIEILQEQVFIGRSFEWGDVLANGAGSILAGFVRLSKKPLKHLHDGNQKSSAS